MVNLDDGEVFSGKIYLAMPWNGQRICGGVGKIDEKKWQPLTLQVSIGPRGHFRGIEKAIIADKKIYRTGKQAAKIAIGKALHASS